MSIKVSDDIKVIDGYFPDWMIDDVATWLTDYCPLYYNNAPYLSLIHI